MQKGAFGGARGYSIVAYVIFEQTGNAPTPTPTGDDALLAVTVSCLSNVGMISEQ